jgi:hypothetical protein
MNKAHFKPEKIYIDSQAAGYPLTEKIQQNTKGIPYEVVESVHELVEDVGMFKDPVSSPALVLPDISAVTISSSIWISIVRLTVPTASSSII